jgi:hypothetical protein
LKSGKEATMDNSPNLQPHPIAQPHAQAPSPPRQPPNPQSQAPATAAPPDFKPSAASPRAAAPVDRQRARQQLVDQCEAAGLKNPNPHNGCLRIIQTDLMRSALATGRALIEALAAPERPQLSTDKKLNNHLRVVQQIERLAKHELRELEVRQKIASKTSQLHQFANPEFRLAADVDTPPFPFDADAESSSPDQKPAPR